MYRKIIHFFWRPRWKEFSKPWLWEYWFWIRIFITRGRGSGEGYVPKLTDFVRHLYDATSQKWMIFETEETAQYSWLKSENLSNWNKKSWTLLHFPCVRIFSENSWHNFIIFQKTCNQLKVKKFAKQFFLKLHCKKSNRIFLKDFCPSL